MVYLLLLKYLMEFIQLKEDRVSKMTKININLKDEFLEKVDYFARDENKNRSEFIREAVAKFMAIKQEEKIKEAKKNKIRDAIELFEKMGKKNKQWDGVKEINRWRELNS